MEINITKFIVKHSDCMEQFSSSVGKSGLDNIGQITWNNACIEMTDEANRLVTGEDLAELIAHFRGYGAWDSDELNSMSEKELNALLIQFIAGDFQERADAEAEGRLEEYEENQGGRLYQSDVEGTEGEWFYYIGD